MKTKFALILIVFGALALEPSAFSRGAAIKRSGGGGGSRPQISRPSGGSSPKISKPAASKPSVSRPSASRPSVSKPSGGGSRLPSAKPAPRPQPKPQRPSGSGSGLPSFAGGGKPKPPERPSTLPATRPQIEGGASKLPDRKPGSGDDFLGLRPDKPGDKPGRPTTLPGKLPGRPGDGNRPDRPVTLPGNQLPGRPGIANRPNRPTTLPGQVGNRPGFDQRPGKPQRPPRPERPDKWQNIHDNNVGQWNNWRQKNEVNINNFQVNRTNNWNNINNRYNERGWAGRFDSDDYREWREDVWDFRKDRCEEIWDRREDFWDDCFDNHWWGSCWWRPRPYVHVNVSPWWWWRPVAWASVGAFFGAAVAPQPVVYDPGTTVIYEGDTYYVNGKASGAAAEARKSAAVLATPAVEEIPVPEPAAEGQPEQWLPLGVWALTQQEQGDATMFMQFSVDKNGIIGGAYKNVLTGDEQPIVGQFDKQSQRAAWHVGEATQTVYETGLSNFENDVASVFVHFGENSTQMWLLVRLPSPEIPPGTVKLPKMKKP